MAGDDDDAEERQAQPSEDGDGPAAAAADDAAGATGGEDGEDAEADATESKAPGSVTGEDGEDAEADATESKAPWSPQGAGGDVSMRTPVKVNSRKRDNDDEEDLLPPADDDLFNDSVGMGFGQSPMPPPAVPSAGLAGLSPGVKSMAQLATSPDAPRSRAGGGAASTVGTEALPEIGGVPPGMHPSAVKAARAAAALPRNAPLLCKLCVMAPKTGKQAYCKKCRSKVESAKTNAKFQDSKLGGSETPNQDQLAALEAAKDPTRLRLMIFDFDLKTDPEGVKVGRGAARRDDYDFCQYEEFWGSDTFVENQVKYKYLTKFKYMKHFTENEGYTPEEAKTQWERDFEGTVPRDYRGPKNEVRLKTKIDEFEVHGSRLSRGSRVTAGLKQKKNPKAEDLEAFRENLGKRHSGFDDEFFEPLGGGEALAHIPGAETKSAFMGDVSMNAGRGVKRLAVGDAESDCGSRCSKAGRLKDRESKLNTLRNACRDAVMDAITDAQRTLEVESGAKAGLLTEEERVQKDYEAMMSTLDVRLAALELVIIEKPAAGHFLRLFRSVGFVVEPGSEGAENFVTPERCDKYSDGDALVAFRECLAHAKKPMPICDFTSISCVSGLCARIETLAEGAETGVDLKEAKKEFLAHVERIKDLTKSVKRAADDIRQRKVAKATKEAKEAEKVLSRAAKQSKAANQQAAEAKQKVLEKAERERKAAEKREAEESVGKSTAPEWKVLSANLAHHTPIPVVQAAGFSMEQVDPGRPYVVRGVDLSKELEPYTSIVNVWMAGFDRNEVVVAKGRAHWPLTDPKNVRQVMLKYGPPSVTDLGDVYGKLLTTVNLFGYSGVMKSSGGEMNSMASMRWQREGSRRVIAASVRQVVSYLREEATPKVLVPSVADVSSALKYADDVTVTALRARGAHLLHASISAGDLLYVPAGYWVLEACNNMERNFGVQTSLLPKVQAGSLVADSFLALGMIKIQSLAEGTMRQRTQKYMDTLRKHMIDSGDDEQPEFPDT